MNYPPWLPKQENSRRGMLLSLARCIYERHYSEEQHIRKGPIKTFDHLGNGDLECVAQILNTAGFTEFIDDIGRRSQFIDDPAKFESIANSDNARAIDLVRIKEAVMRLANDNCHSSEEIDYLALEIQTGL